MSDQPSSGKGAAKWQVAKIIACCILLAPAAMLGVHAQPATGACPDLAGLKLDHVTITQALAVPAGALPAYCRIVGSARPTPDSDIRFEVAIPEGGAWNGRYLQVGNGG